MLRKPGRPASPSFEATPMVMALAVALGFFAYAGWDTSSYPPLKPRKGQVVRKGVAGTSQPVTIEEELSPSGYADTLKELQQLNREAEILVANGKNEEAGKLVQRGETIASKLLSIPRPSLEATEAASDTDHLYGRMLAANRNYGWARLQFQKNVVRWKYWKPQTPETERRLRLALAAIEDTDRHISQ